jgi:hypothetical protein
MSETSIYFNQTTELYSRRLSSLGQLVFIVFILAVKSGDRKMDKNKRFNNTVTQIELHFLRTLKYGTVRSLIRILQLFLSVENLYWHTLFHLSLQCL